MKKKYVVRLTPQERERIQEVLDSPGTTKTIRNRCQVLLHIDSAPGGEAMTQERCAAEMGMAVTSIGGIAARYCSSGLEGCLAIQRNPASDEGPRKVTPEVEDAIVALATSGTLDSAGKKWNASSIARESEARFGMALSRTTIVRILGYRHVIL